MATLRKFVYADRNLFQFMSLAIVTRCQAICAVDFLLPTLVSSCRTNSKLTTNSSRLWVTIFFCYCEIFLDADSHQTPCGASGDVFYALFFQITNSRRAAEFYSTLTIHCTKYVCRCLSAQNVIRIFAYHVITIWHQPKNYANWWKFNKTSSYVKCFERALTSRFFSP